MCDGSSDGHHGFADHLQAAEHQQEAPPAQDLALLGQKTANHAPQSGLMQRHYLRPRQEWLSVSCSNYGLGDAQSVGLAALKYSGSQLLR
tara:strand:+ start:157 stop:426 length:270 start_codon:yes stop_codon:yes gene_type:complete